MITRSTAGNTIIKSIIRVLVFLIIISADLFSQNIDTSDNKYKVAGETFYNPHSPVFLENDSVYFDGYLIFEAHRFDDNKFVNDWSFYQFEIYILDSLEKIKDHAKRCYYNSFFLDYYYADEEGIGYDTGTGTNKNKGTVIITEDLREQFQGFKGFYSKYLHVRTYSENKYFMMGTLRTKIFENPNVYLWKYNNDSISYFVFKCSFYTAILKYDAYYIAKDGQKVFLKDLLFFLPVSKAMLFEPVDENTISKAGFTKSEWYPPDLFLKEQK